MDDRTSAAALAEADPVWEPRHNVAGHIEVSINYELENFRFASASVELRQYTELYAARRLKWQVNGTERPAHNPTLEQVESYLREEEARKRAAEYAALEVERANIRAQARLPATPHPKRLSFDPLVESGDTEEEDEVVGVESDPPAASKASKRAPKLPPMYRQEKLRLLRIEVVGYRKRRESISIAALALTATSKGGVLHGKARENSLISFLRTLKVRERQRLFA